jgi:hypothetical protein
MPGGLVWGLVELLPVDKETIEAEWDVLTQADIGSLGRISKATV